MKFLSMTAACALMAASPAAFAMNPNMSSELVKSEDGRVQLTDQAVSGRELLGADINDYQDPVGTVDDVILNRQGEIDVLSYETSRYRDLDGEGYLAIKSIELDPAVTSEVEIELADTTSPEDPDTFRLTEREQQTLMLSNILRDEMIVDGTIYNVRDVVFDKRGKAHYLIVAEQDGSFWRDGQAFTVPFSEARYSDGAWRTGTDLMPIVIVASVD